MSIRISPTTTQCGTTYGNAHTTGTRNQPTPNRSSRASSIERVGEGGHDRGKQTADTDGKGEGRQVAKLSLEDGLVTKLGGQLCISITHLSQIEGLSLPIGAIDLDDAGALLPLASTIIEVRLDVVRNFGHGGVLWVFDEASKCVYILLRPRQLTLTFEGRGRRRSRRKSREEKEEKYAVESFARRSKDQGETRRGGERRGEERDGD